MTEIKPCPFCGEEAEYSKIDTSKTVPFGTVQHFVTCKKNCLEGLYARGNTKEEAIKEWNTRPNTWHTGTPTEEGDYLVAVSYYPLIQVEYQINRYLLEPYNDFIYQIEGEGRIVAWQKIEPYKEIE